MSSSASPPQTDDSRDQFNLGTMLLITLGAIVGTTITVWAVHFAHIDKATANALKPLPHIAVLPFRSLSSSPEDVQQDLKLTKEVEGRLDQISRVEEVPPEMAIDPVLVGRELAVKAILFGKIERSGLHQTRVRVQMVSAQDGKQLWTGTFNSDAADVSGLSKEIDDAVAPHLTALLD